MSGISQTIPNYVLGISEQPDQLKSQGQVRDLVNAIPDVSLMLVKRQGTELVEQISPVDGTNDANEHVGKWFDIYRDPNEQYMGVVRQNGSIQIWRLVNGPTYTYRNTAGTADVTSRNYVNVIADTSTTRTNGQGYNATGDNYNADYNNVATTNTTDNTATGLTVNFEVVDGTCQSVKINRMGNANYESGDRFTIDGFAGITCQYFVGNAGEEVRVHYDNDFVTPYSVRDFTWPFNTARLPRGITNLTHSDYLEHTDSNNIKTLTVNDTTILVNRGTRTAMTNAVEPAVTNVGFVEVTTLAFSQVYKFTINQGGTDFEIESAATAATSATVDGVLDDLIGKVDALDNFSAIKVGNGLQITATAGGVFSLSTSESQLLNVFTDEVQDITLLPEQCVDGYRVKVANSGALEDDYYVQFESSVDGQNGKGVWTEHRGFGVATTIDASTMPHVMVRMSDASFLVTPADYEQRLVGDTTTNPNPSFIGHPINNVALFRNRLAFVSRQNVILSRPGDFYNFFVTTALSITAKDPIDISASAVNPATIFDTIEVNAGLMLFSRSEQFMLTTDNDILSPETAKINFVSSYDYDIDVSPFTLGTTVSFVNDEAGNTRLYEMQNPPREGQPEVIEQSKIISTRLPSGVTNVTASKTNSVVFLGYNTRNELWGYRYFNTGERRIQNAWFRFTIPGNCIHQTIIRDTWFGCVQIDDSGTGGSGNNIVSLVAIDLVPNDTSISVPGVPQQVPLLVNLDNRVNVAHGDLNYNANNDQTTFTLPFDYARTKLSGTDTTLMAFQVGDGVDEQCVDISTTGGNRVNVINAAFNTVTLEGNWTERTSLAITTNTAGNLGNGQFVSLSVRHQTGTTGSGMKVSGVVENGQITKVIVANPGTGYVTGDVVSIAGAPNSRLTITVTDLSLWVGYSYLMQVDFPTIYPVKGGANQIKADVQGSLIIHRCKFNTGATGTFSVDLGRVGRPTYSAIHESRPMDAYQANNTPFLLVDETTVPCYERNYNINLSLKSKYPLPVTLISMTWEGEYTNKNYRRS